MSGIGKESLLFHFETLVLLLFMSFQVLICYESDSIIPGQTLSGNQTISSLGWVFEMGFFSPGNTGNYYLGIWYKDLPLPEKTVVWVANRDYPVSDPHSSFLEFAHDGNLVLNTSNGLIWSTNLTPITPHPYGVLGDDGNFIIYGGSLLPFLTQYGRVLIFQLIHGCQRPHFVMALSSDHGKKKTTQHQGCPMLR